MGFIRKLLAWAKKNERHISTIVFLGGFVSDLFTYTSLPISFASLVFAGTLTSVAFCILGNYVWDVKGLVRKSGLVWRVGSVLLPLGVQFFTGNLLSGFLIFYTKSSVVFASWPFLLLLALIFIGNEFLHDFKSHLAFQTVLFFFALYAYAIFEVPLVMGAMGPQYFIASTVLSCVVFALFMVTLALISFKKFLSAEWYVLAGPLAVVALVVAAYFTGLIPPIPLTLTDAGVYHSVARVGDTYRLETEADTPVYPWWQVASWKPVTLHLSQGSTLSAFSAIVAPTSFGTSVVDRWEIQNPATHKWELVSQISYPISGGRNGGYRGYTTIAITQAGSYRVSIETTSGQVIGRVPFAVEFATTTPALLTEYK